ncbi:MAG: M50 family metallopeptidase [Acidobacteria bacterium]|nr:M50 family metallopeptidase [Acidobacteriota bacterium]
MSYTIAEDAKPQVMLLAAATLISVGLWVVAWFIPAAAYIYYPLQLFATFIHEASHALVALLTGNSVSSLTVSPDTSGAVWSSGSGLSGLLISSAGYVGATAYGTALLVWIRFGRSPRTPLYFSGALIGLMTISFGLLLPFWNFFDNVTLGSVAFTVFAGLAITAALFAIARWAPIRWAHFALAFLSVQCLLNAFFSLRDLFVISTTTDRGTDAANMAAATGIPAVIWVVLWVAISLVIIALGIRLYAATGKKGTDTVFEDKL